MTVSEYQKACGRLDCFANKGEARCSLLTDTSFPKRGGTCPGDKCPFYKTVKEAKIQFVYKDKDLNGR